MSAGSGTGADGAGTVLDGRYRLGALIAKGGMSTVYRGVDLRLDRPVAIKIMRAEYAMDPSFLTRFEREARTAAGLHHNGVVSVYDQGRDGDTVFLVMELIDGGTLRDVIRQQGALSVPVALSILEPVLSALGAAHEAGLVHRDIKPENVLISSRGEVKVADFGLVRAITSTTMATGDVILGTVAYLSPEQVSTGYADARSDVYSAGIVAFEMLTGTTPFVGDNAISVAYQHVHSDVPAPSSQAIGVPDPLDRILVRATARNATDRPADAAAFLTELIQMRARLMIRRVPVPVPTSVLPGPSGTQVLPAVAPRPTLQTPVSSETAEHPPGATPPPGAPPPGPPPPAMSSRAPATPRTEPVARPVDPAVLRQRRRRRRIWIAIILVVLLGAAAAVTGWWLGSGRWTAVPPLKGVAQESAVEATRAADLVPVISTQHDNDVPSGRVASVTPAEGERQLRGSEIQIVVSSGRPTVPVIEPGTDPTAAIAALLAADLDGAVDDSAAVYDPVVEVGQVVTTDPAAGAALDIGTTVTIVVSKGKQPVAVPSVVDKSVVDAENALKVAGLLVGAPVPQFDPARKAGTVIGAVPAEGQTVDSGSTVQLVVSNSIEVPGVVGMAQDAAAAALQAVGLTLVVGRSTFDPNVDGGSVISSDPGPGALLDPANATVTVVVSTAITMPNLVGQDVEQAAAQLSDAGLYVRLTSFFGLGNEVTSQTPSAGTRVAPGSTVELSTI